MQLFGMNSMPASGLNNSFTKRRLEKMTQKIFWKHGILPFGYTILECAILFVCFGCRPSGSQSVIFTADTKTLDLLQRPHSKKVADMQNSASDSKKLKKPRFVESLNDTLLFDIVATDTYDSLFFSLTMNEDDNVTISSLAQTVQGEYKMISDYYIGLYNEKYVAKRKGYENSDTLYGVRVTGLRNNNEIMVSNEGATLKFFGKDYGQSISVYDMNGKLVAEGDIRNGMTEIPIPIARGYLKEVLIVIKYDEHRNYNFKYPIR